MASTRGLLAAMVTGALAQDTGDCATPHCFVACGNCTCPDICFRNSNCHTPDYYASPDNDFCIGSQAEALGAARFEEPGANVVLQDGCRPGMLGALRVFQGCDEIAMIEADAYADGSVFQWNLTNLPLGRFDLHPEEHVRSPEDCAAPCENCYFFEVAEVAFRGQALLGVRLGYGLADSSARNGWEERNPDSLTLRRADGSGPAVVCGAAWSCQTTAVTGGQAEGRQGGVDVDITTFCADEAATLV